MVNIAKNVFVVLLISIIFVSEIQYTQCAFSVEMFNGETGCNVYLVFDSQQAMLVDAGGVNDTVKLINFISAQGVDQIDLVFLTHGHPDHFGGVGQLSGQYPGAKFAVSSNDIKTELVQTAAIVQITDYDFANDIDIVGNSDTTLSHFSLKINDDYLPGESEFASTLFNSKNNIFFAGDIIYVDDHLYLGTGVDLTRVINWHDDNLPSLGDGGRIGLTPSTTIYPGHGGVGSTDNVGDNMDYLNTFLDTLLTCFQGEFPSLDEVANLMIEQYPTLGGTFFTSFITSNPAWNETQSQFGSCAKSVDYFASSASSYSSTSDSSMLHSSLIFIVVLLFLTC